MIYFDSETCGLHGFVVLIQWAEDDGPINLHEVWKRPVSETLALIEMIAESEVCGFNLTFDWFHLSKCYNTFLGLPMDLIPEQNIELVAEVEAESRTIVCLKPKAACDLMLVARRGKFQALMDRKDVKIRKVPTALAQPLAEYLDKNVELDPIYFARKKDKFAPRWKVYDIKKAGKNEPEFKNVVLKFHPDGGLKSLARHALGIKDTLSLGDMGVEEQFQPRDYGWAPFAKYVDPTDERKFKHASRKWKGTWPDVIKYHISFWSYNPIGRQYAEDDITYTRGLHRFFDSPAAGDRDSTLACMVGAVRWRGFAINVERMKVQREKAFQVSRSAPKAPERVKEWLYEVMDPTERLGMVDRDGNPSTKKVILELISKWNSDGTEADKEKGNHPAAVRASAVLKARRAKKEVELYDKLISAGRFHASFRIMGTLSNRMSGGDGLNAQGISHQEEVRECFTLADNGLVLCGGDFDSFEVSIAEAVYNDENMRKDLQSGKKIHALFAMELFPGKTYEEILKSKGTIFDMYDTGKKGVFALIYQGDENTLQVKLGIPVEIGQRAMIRFKDRYPGIRREQKAIFDAFCSMRQPNGLGTKVEWHEPQDFVESFLGFRRYFTLENQICKALFKLANSPPREWFNFKIKVVRRDREQTVAGAVQSALYAAAFQLQAKNMRAAGNHKIQSPGAEITKETQVAIWTHQPVGVHAWVVVPMQVHDELMCPTQPSHVSAVKATVDAKVASYRDRVPLIAMEYKTDMETWADK